MYINATVAYTYITAEEKKKSMLLNEALTKYESETL